MVEQDVMINNSTVFAHKNNNVYHMSGSFKDSLWSFKHCTCKVWSHFFWCLLSIFQHIALQPNEARTLNLNAIQQKLAKHTHHLFQQHIWSKLLTTDSKLARNLSQASLIANTYVVRTWVQASDTDMYPSVRYTNHPKSKT